MRIKSPLSNLSETIEQVRSSAGRYRDTLQRNEAATRAVLIDPVLHALGWDTANTFMAEVEKFQQSTYVDYALYDRNGGVALVVEAKQLGTNLEDKSITMNLVKYAFVYGTTRIVLTDGLVWQLISVLGPGKMDIDSVNFLTDRPVDCASFLVQHLDAARFWGDEQTIDELAERISQLESNLATLQKQFASVSESLLPSLPAVPPPPRPAPETDHLAPVSPVTPAVPTTDAPFVNLSSVGEVTGTAPSLLRLPDGTEVRVRRWRDVLRECVKFALDNNPDIPVPLPDRSGKKVRLLNNVRPPAGLSFIEEQYRGQSLFIYANYDANNCVSNALYILRQVPAAAADAPAAVVYSSR